MAALATRRVHAADCRQLGLIPGRITGFIGGILFLLHLCPGQKPPSGISLPASSYECVVPMNIVHAGCSIESFLKGMRKILAGEGGDFAALRVEQPQGQGSHLGNLLL